MQTFDDSQLQNTSVKARRALQFTFTWRLVDVVLGRALSLSFSLFLSLSFSLSFALSLSLCLVCVCVCLLSVVCVLKSSLLFSVFGTRSIPVCVFTFGSVCECVARGILAISSSVCVCGCVWGVCVCVGVGVSVCGSVCVCVCVCVGVGVGEIGRAHV